MKGKATYRDIMKTVVVEPDEIPLLKKNGERYKTYDEKLVVPVVIQRQRIVKARPRFNSWKLCFSVEFDEKLVGPDVMREILNEGGRTVGIGDWRPKYGRFKVAEFKVL